MSLSPPISEGKETTSYREALAIAHVITGLCRDTKDQSCVEVCPVDCIHPASHLDGDARYQDAPQLYIDPVTCIDCGACVPACPVGAIMMAEELSADDQQYIAINAEYFSRGVW